MDTKYWLNIGITLSCMVVVCITTSLAYFVANITHNNVNETRFEAASIGSINYNGTLTFTEQEVYPGMKAIQTFTIEKGSQEGTGIYEIDLASTVPEVFKSDIEITLYKTTTPEENNVERVEGELTQTAEGFIKEDQITINGTPEIVYGPEVLTESEQIILEQADFDTSTLAKTTYYLVYNYKNNGNQNAQQGQTFSGKVTVRLITSKTSSIVDQIIIQVDTTGKCPTVNEDGTVVVNGKASTDGYVCTAPDDYGTSYYFRGNVENNWVKFANSYWRIIRINGDNTIRMIYAGDASVIDALENKEEVLKNGYNDEDTGYTQIGTSAFNSSRDDNAYVGYMYGNQEEIVEGDYNTARIIHRATDTIYYAQEYTYDEETDRFTLKDPVALLGTEVTEDYVGWYTMGNSRSTYSRSSVYKVTSVTPSDGSSSASIKFHYVAYGTTSKEKAQENINDSTIKNAIDSWYESHIKGTEYESYIADTLFCNDRSFNESNTGTGFGLSRTYYRAYGGNMTLKCSQQNDRFTVEEETIGNGDLTYSVALITSDEVYLAGGYSSSNSSYYLYTGNDYWTFSPFYFYGDDTRVRSVDNYGSTNYFSVDSFFGVRPVINLKAGSLKTGSGTALDPYTV